MESDRQAQKQDSVFVAGKEFTVDIEYLSSISPYILNTLFGPMKNKDNEINGVDVKDFKLFLAIINGENCLKHVNIERALETCDFLMCDVALEICKKWIIVKSQLDPRVEFAIGVKYRWNEVKNSVLNGVKTILDVEKILPENLEAWDTKTTQMVLEKVMSFFEIIDADQVGSEDKVNAENKKLKIQLKAIQEREKEILTYIEPPIARRQRNQQRGPSIFNIEKLDWNETTAKKNLLQVLTLFGMPRNEQSEKEELEKLQDQIFYLRERMDHNTKLQLDRNFRSLDQMLDELMRLQENLQTD